MTSCIFDRSSRQKHKTLCLVIVLTLLGTPALAADLTVTITGVEPGGGRVFVSLCEGGLDPQFCTIGTSRDPEGAAMTFAFPDVAPGSYAVAAYQDRNGNGQLDRTRNGLPREPFGISNGAGRRHAPTFEQAAFRLSGDRSVVIRLVSIMDRQ